MWECQKCGWKNNKDDRICCWNCGIGKDGSPPNDPLKPPPIQPEGNMFVDIKEQVKNLSDEEIIKMLTTHFPDNRKEWIDISNEELKKRGFVLEPADSELKVITPTNQKLNYPKIQSDVRGHQTGEVT